MEEKDGNEPIDSSKSFSHFAGKPMSLADVFQSMNLTTYDLTVDMLDVHAVIKLSLNATQSNGEINFVFVSLSAGSKHFPSFR